jgi:hypothetical protein
MSTSTSNASTKQLWSWFVCLRYATPTVGQPTTLVAHSLLLSVLRSTADSATVAQPTAPSTHARTCGMYATACDWSRRSLSGLPLAKTVGTRRERLVAGEALQQRRRARARRADDREEPPGPHQAANPYTTSLCAEAMGFYGCNVASHSMPLYIALPL